jgi:BolA protein
MTGDHETPTPVEIERRLRARLQPVILQLIDDSAKHIGHKGATSGGGHYRLVIVSSGFEGKGSIERHRMVHEILADLFGERIHALSMRTLTPDQWEAGEG